MNNFMPRVAWSGSAGKKYFLIATMFLLAAACSKQQPQSPPAPTGTGNPGKVISISSPKAGDVWQIGSAQTITWQRNNPIDGDIVINLVPDDNPHDTDAAFRQTAKQIGITGSAPKEVNGVGQFSWTVGNDVLPGMYSVWISVCEGSCAQSQNKNATPVMEQDGSSGEFSIADAQQTATSTPLFLTVKYDNTQYGFTFSLPADWQGFSVLTKQWTGTPLAGSSYKQNISGPEIYIRNPNWTNANPYEDIPVMVFTPAEWNEIQQEKLGVSAAPIPPSELGQNQNYVFALPPRFDYDYLTGYQEVEQIVQSNPLAGY